MENHRNEEENDPMEETLPPVPPDGGWGWMVVFGSFVIHIIADGVAYSFGVFLIEFLDYFETGRGALGWIGSLMVGVTLGSGPIASILTNKYGCRPVTIVGGVIACIAFILSIFAPNVYMLYVTFGVLAGLGLGLIYLPAIVSVTYYFEKRRAFATGLAVCGSGVGTFIFAPLSKKLIDTYGWKGAALIEAGLLLNCCVCGALFRPLKRVRRPLPQSETEVLLVTSPSDVTPRLDGATPHCENNGVVTASPGVPARLSHSTYSLPRHTPERDVTRFSSDIHLAIPAHRSRSHGSHRHRTVSESVSHPMDRKDALYSGSLTNIPLYRSNRDMYHASVHSLVKTNSHVEQTAVRKSDSSSKCCSPAVRKALKEMMDFSLLKDWLFLIFAISNFATSVGFNVPYIFLPDRAVLLGISKDNAAFLISVIGIANTVGRVVFGLLSDMRCVNRQMLYNTALTLCGVFTILSVYCTTYPWLVAYAALFGLLIGVYVSLTSVVLVDLLGLDRLTSSFGLLLLFQGCATIIGPPIAGWVYDATQSYDTPFFITGSMIGVSGFMLYAIPCIRKLQQRRHAATDTDVQMGMLAD